MIAKLVFAAAHISAVVSQQLVPGVEHKFLGAKSASKSNAQKMLDVKQLSLDPGPEEIQAMEETIETLVSNGENPAHIKAVKQMLDFLVKTIIPNREKQLKLDQEQLDSKSDDIKQCSIKKAQNSDMVLNDKMDLVDHHNDTYVKHTAKLGECLQVEEAKKLVKDAHCPSVQDAGQVCSCHSQITEAVGPPPNVNCTNTSIPPDWKVCCDKFAAYKLHQITCQNVKNNVQYAQRQSAIIMHKICADYSECYDGETKEYKHVEQLVKGNEERRSLKTLYKLRCMVDAFDEDKSTEQEVKACKEKKYDVKTIKYPETVTKDSCKSPVPP